MTLCSNERLYWFNSVLFILITELFLLRPKEKQRWEHIILSGRTGTSWAFFRPTEPARSFNS